MLINSIYKAFDGYIARPVNEWADEHTRSIFINMLKTGKLPQHVAFIMDGNRRYATEKGKKFNYGHQAGALALLQIIDSSLKLGIPHLSMYAFSLENFNRSQEEVSMLFELLMVKLSQFLNEKDKFNKSARVRIIGNRDYIPPETLEKLVEIERVTANNTEITLNFCFAYTSRDEITHSIKVQTQAAVDGLKQPKNITQTDLVNSFYFPPDTPPLDLLIRTSGHTRLSDFMAWQISWPITDVVFLATYWPSFSVFQYYYQLMRFSYRKEVGSKLIHDEIIQRIGIKKEYFGKVTSNNKSGLHHLTKPPPFVTITGEMTTN